MAQQPNIQQPDETLPGFKSQQVYDFSGADSVNLFSGDVHVTVPLGPEYPLSSGLTWRLAAHYSSKFWHMFRYDSGTTDALCNREVFVSRAQVAGYSTIGVGWTLELGSVRPFEEKVSAASYKSPDGARHGFDNLDADSDFRLDRQGDGTYVVRKSDGTVMIFAHLYQIPAPVNGFDFSDEDRTPGLGVQTRRYGLSSIVDRFGNTVLQVTYFANCSSMPCSADAWKVHFVDLWNPARRITFNWGMYAGSGSFDVVNSVDFAGAPTANFTFRPDGTFFRSSFDSMTAPAEGQIYPSGPPSTSLPFLASISQASQTYSFDYDTSGILQTLTLPTGGRIVYAYGPNTTNGPQLCRTCVPEESAGLACGLGSPTQDPPIPSDLCTQITFRQPFIDASQALISRTERDLAGGAPDATTTYERKEYGSPDYPSDPTTQMNPDRVVRRVIVKRPDGNGNTVATKYVFSAAQDGADGLELSRRYYADCNTGGTPVRSVVQCFPDCGVIESAPYGTDRIRDVSIVESLRPSQIATWYGQNPRVSSKATCDPSAPMPPMPTACWKDDFGDYNPNASEYTTVTRSSNSGILIFPQTATRTTATAWVCPSSTPPSWCDPLGSGIWLPKLFSSKTVTDGPSSCPNTPCAITTTYSFDTTNGFLNWSRVADDTYGTITRSFPIHDPWGSPLTESLSGTGTIDPTTYVKTRTFQSGLSKSMQWTAPAGIGWKSFDVDRDFYTGHITGSRDPNGLTTTYQYDSLFRLISVTLPAGELPSTYCYNDWSASSADMASVFVKKGGVRCGEDDGAPGMGSGPFDAYQYDGMGRVRREMHRLPNPDGTGSYFAFREHRYNSAGLKVFDSEWTPCGTASGFSSVRSCFASVASSGTSYSAFDFLGRAKTVTAADGSVTSRSFDDGSTVSNSDFYETDTFNVWNGSQSVSVTGGSRKDILGRTLLVAEPYPGPIGPLTPLTGYGYNVLDKVAWVNVNQSGAQTRTFSYDALGLLRSENHPETGITAYNSFDARGKPLQWVAANGLPYGATYDPAGRQTLLTVSSSIGSSTYQKSIFDDPASSGTYPLSRLSHRIGYNPGTSPPYTVTEDFVYSDPTGRLSEKTTTVGSSPSMTVTEKWLYNPLGLVQHYFHPRTADPTATPFVISTGYTSGQPILVTANGIPVVTSATYQPYGGLASYSTGDGTGHDVTTTIAADPHLMPRPGQIDATGVNGSFHTGPFSYDGAGNVYAMGNDTFGYDSRSRLISANLNAVGSQTYQYDAFGNLYTRVGGPNPLALSIDTPTNRITPTTVYNYDSLGNLLTPPGESLTYDSLSQLTTASLSGNTWYYYYTGAGERVLKASNVAGNTFTFRDPDNRLTTEYLPHPDYAIAARDNVFLGSLLVGSYANVDVSGNGSNSWVYYSSDHLGTPRLLTDDQGNTVEMRRSWPYGEDVASPPPSTAQRLRFSTMERDPEGLRYYDHARSHSFGIARFLSPDKLGGKITDPQSWNRYIYAGNNPLTRLDQNGLADDYFAQAAKSFHSAGANAVGIPIFKPGFGPSIGFDAKAGPVSVGVSARAQVKANPIQGDIDLSLKVFAGVDVGGHDVGLKGKVEARLVEGGGLPQDVTISSRAGAEAVGVTVYEDNNASLTLGGGLSTVELGLNLSALGRTVADVASGIFSTAGGLLQYTTGVDPAKLFEESSDPAQTQRFRLVPAD